MKKLLIIMTTLACMAQARPSISENFNGDDQEYKDYIQKLYVKVNNPNSTNIQKDFKDMVNSEHKRLFPQLHQTSQPPAQKPSTRAVNAYPKGNPIRYGEQYSEGSTKQPIKPTRNTETTEPANSKDTATQPPAVSKEPPGIIDMICAITEEDIYRFICGVAMSTALALIILSLVKFRKIRGQTNA